MSLYSVPYSCCFVLRQESIVLQGVGFPVRFSGTRQYLFFSYGSRPEPLQESYDIFKRGISNSLLMIRAIYKPDVIVQRWILKPKLFLRGGSAAKRQRIE